MNPENWTEDWTPWMWSAIADLEVSQQPQLIAHFKKKAHLWKDGMCDICGLEPRALNINKEEL